MKKLTVLIFIIILLNTNAQIPKYENIVFEGAGIMGLAYSGVIKQLEEYDMIKDFEKIGGTSAGAITATMLTLGYESNEILEIISATKFQKFNDKGFVGLSRLAKKYGWFKGEKFTEWISEIIYTKTGNKEITFKELDEIGFKKLYITATSMNRQKLLVFSVENYPNMKVKDAVRCSMSIPLYFEAVFIDSIGTVYKKQNENNSLDLVVDGGIIGNYPIFLFDSSYVDDNNNLIRIPNKKTLGVRIDSKTQVEKNNIDQSLVHYEINNIIEYLTAFYALLEESLNRSTMSKQDWERTISVSNAGISPKIKKLSKKEKDSLTSSGEFYTRNFLEKFKIKKHK